MAPMCCGRVMVINTKRDEYNCGECRVVVDASIAEARLPVIGPATEAALKHRAAASAARVAAAKAWDQIPRGRSVEADPLDVTYDAISLRALLRSDELNRRESPCPQYFTPTQRTAISAHWSAELKRKVAAKAAADKERERNVVTMDGEEW